MKRLFAAVELPPAEDLLKGVEALRRKLAFENIRWVDPKNMHITLKFFGETPEDKIPGIAEALRNAVSSFAPIRIEVCKTGIFGSSYHPRVIWAGVEDGGKLSEMQRSIALQLETIGIIGDRQNFVPHLTLARMKEIRDKKHFQDCMAGIRQEHYFVHTAKQLLLFESILKSSGPEYKILEVFGFGQTEK